MAASTTIMLSERSVQLSDIPLAPQVIILQMLTNPAATQLSVLQVSADAQPFLGKRSYLCKLCSPQNQDPVLQCRRPLGASHRKLLQPWPKLSRYQALVCMRCVQIVCHCVHTLMFPTALDYKSPGSMWRVLALHNA